VTARTATITAPVRSPAGVCGKAKSHTARLTSAALYLSGAVVGASTGVTRQLPSGDALRMEVTQAQIRVNASTLAPGQKEQFMASAVCHCFLPVESARIPQHLKEAVIAIEDHRFRVHRGVDPQAMGRAIWLLFRGKRQGGSTITMQLAKTMVTGGTRSFPDVVLRKLREMVVARRLERMMSKDEIIAAYLNAVDFGASDGWTAFGIEQAALKFFGKFASELNLYESAMLAGALKGTKDYSPHLNPTEAHNRAEAVLMRMVALGYISQAIADRALRARSRPGKREAVRVPAQFYIDWLFDDLVNLTEGHDLKGQLRFVVGLDPLAQLRAEAAIAAGAKDIPNGSETEAAIASMRPDGRVVALVGGRDFQRSQFNRATKAQRQPASAFKPFVYAAAIEAGYRPDSMIFDAPLRPDQGWPENFDRVYRGRVSINYAMQHSLNAATVRLATQIGLPKIIDLAHRLGVSGDFPSNPSIALGSREVSLLGLTAAYGAFANDGRRVLPYGAIMATDARGYTFYRRTKPTGGPVLTPDVVSAMRAMLRSAMTQGTGRNALLAGARWSGGKTGTSQDFRDAWFIGLTDTLVTGVWVGNDDRSPMHGVTGSGVPAVIWKRFNSDVRNLPAVFRAAPLGQVETVVPDVDHRTPVVPLPRSRPNSAIDASPSPTAPDPRTTGAATPRGQRQVVAYAGGEPAGTIVVDTKQRFLYLVQDNGRAFRYQVAVGRPGFTWSGTRTITAKREWPDWHPPANMRRRKPGLPESAPGGPTNPLGARALYLGSTLYRIHGSNEPNSIGQPVSSGCFRMHNEDIVDLYTRVGVGTRVVVY
jgi:penicillin-binding protein 1A